ncbi:MAG: nucleotidyltransferase family protein [Myxococcota bacterium]
MLSADVVREVARTLGPIDVDVMPVKGALMQHWLYDDPADRAMTDVDILVRAPDLERAREALAAAGYVFLGQTGLGACLMRAPVGLALDLHPRLFDSARYRLTTDAVFARSTFDETLYGVRVHLPSLLDAYAHLIGKFGSDHLNAAATERLDEIVRMGRHLASSGEGLAASAVAAHLVDVGMGRVSRYVLGLASQSNDSTAAAVLAALPRDAVGTAIVSCVDPVLRSRWSESPAGASAAHMLNHSLTASCRSAARALVHRMAG